MSDELSEWIVEFGRVMNGICDLFENDGFDLTIHRSYINEYKLIMENTVKAFHTSNALLGYVVTNWHNGEFIIDPYDVNHDIRNVKYFTKIDENPDGSLEISSYKVNEYED